MRHLRQMLRNVAGVLLVSDSAPVTAAEALDAAADVFARLWDDAADRHPEAFGCSVA